MDEKTCWETYEFHAVNVPRIDTRGTRVCGIPGRFVLTEVVIDAKKRYRVIAIDIHQKQWTKDTEEVRRRTAILLSEAEVHYALEHQQFARRNTEDTLQRVERLPKKKRK